MADLFPDAQTSFKAKLQSAVQSLAANGIYIGASSWKYSGWTGLLYDEQRYHYRGKFAETRFERDCLTEYAETFKTVCVDAAYYQFPSATYVAGHAAQVPDDLRFTFKVTDDSTPSGAKSARCGVEIQPADLAGFNRQRRKPERGLTRLPSSSESVPRTKSKYLSVEASK